MSRWADLLRLGYESYDEYLASDAQAAVYERERAPAIERAHRDYMSVPFAQPNSLPIAASPLVKQLAEVEAAYEAGTLPESAVVHLEAIRRRIEAAERKLGISSGRA